ncbi:MAG: hypothetical protein JO317_05540, partial [Verrucomicrobiae bacterium]|nr:hypothetical protein [Verrucomicrobiae bacterium]
DDATIEIELPDSGGKAVRMNREEYRKYLEKGYALLDEYAYRREGSDVEIASDGMTGSSTHRILETIRVGSARQQAESEETVVFGLRDGHPQITKLHAKIVQAQ